VARFGGGDLLLQANDVELDHPDFLVGAVGDLADVGQADPVLGQPFEFRRHQLHRRQPGQVERLPERVAGPGVIGLRLGRGGARRGPAEDHPQARLEEVWEDLAHQPW
jgi:hypothetical protein